MTDQQRVEILKRELKETRKQLRNVMISRDKWREKARHFRQVKK